MGYCVKDKAAVNTNDFMTFADGFAPINEKLFVGGDEFFAAMFNDIAGAEQSIELESYIFSKDDLGEKIIAALIQAANRGVQVRVLIDGIGSADDGKDVASTLESEGVRVKIYHPLPWQVDRYHFAVKQGSVFGRLLYFIQKINKRNHRKLCIVDNTHAWTGSLNISAKHLSTEAGGEGWHDFGVRISGAMVPPIRTTFDSLWQRKKLLNWSNPLTRFVSNLSPRMRHKKNHFLLNKISNASQRIWISSAYFSPSRVILRALAFAATKRGVEVNIIVPSKSDVLFFPLLTASYYADLLKMGANVFEYTPSFLHAKALIIDDMCIVGSSNLNHRSFLHDLELDVILTQPSTVNHMQEQFITDMSLSKRVTTQHLKSRAWYLSIAWVPRLLRYWL
jgi:cardiolipin synthase A/B